MNSIFPAFAAQSGAATMVQVIGVFLAAAIFWKSASVWRALAWIVSGLCLFAVAIPQFVPHSDAVVIFLEGLFCVSVVSATLISSATWTKFRAIQKTRRAAERHVKTLARKREQLRWRDDYGTMQDTGWNKEISRFIHSTVVPTLSKRERTFLQGNFDDIVKRVDRRISRAGAGKLNRSRFRDSMSGLEFEAYCAEQLRGCGWETQVTRGSHDQGVDIVAKKNDWRVVLQCKLYSSPVGNSAIQQIVAGKYHERADVAAVVTNSSYTPSAKQLAQSNDILLLHHNDLTM